MKHVFKYLVLSILLSTNDLFSQIITLPVELVHFNFQLEDSSKVLLNWETATETNNAGFDVQRYFGNVWETLTFIPGAGTSNSPKYYNFLDTTIVTGNIYLYRLKQIDNVGDFIYSDTLIVSIISDIKKESDTNPNNFFVSQNYPNPFNPSTNIRVEIPKANEIILKVYDTLGKLVLERNYGDKMPGVYLISFDASHLSSGIYFYSISCGKDFKAQSMVLLK